jgi:putative membrane protein
LPERRARLKRMFAELVFAAGLVASVWLVLHLGVRPVGHALSVIGVGGVLLVALAHLPTIMVLGLAWAMLARDTGRSQPARYIWGRLMRDAGGEMLPLSQLGGVAIGARALNLTGVPGVEATVTSFLDLFVEQVAKTPYAAAAVALLLWLVPGSPLTAPALVILALSLGLVGLVVVKRDWVRARLLKFAANLDRRRNGAAGAGRAEAAMAEALAPRGRLGLSLGLHLIAWALGAVETWIAFRLLGVEIRPAEAIVIDGLFVTVRSFAFAVPAAVGVQEGAYVVLCALFGIGAPTALAFSLVRRARDLLVGAPAVLVWQLIERQRRTARRAIDA